MANNKIRLLLSGGGHRANVASLGAVAYLLHAGKWSDVDEVVSVSGGSMANAVLAGAGDGDDDTWEALARSVHHLRVDKGRVWANPRRLAISVAGAAGFALLFLALAVALGLGPGSDLPRAVAFAGGALAIPIAFRLGGSAAHALTREFIASLTGDRTAELKSREGRTRRHVFCASGLSSGMPYYLWTGRPWDCVDEDVTWGAKLQAPYSIVDAASASVSLPSLGRVRAPTNPADPDLLIGGEVLVDGGVSGIFGDQIGERFRRNPADTDRTERPTVIAIDAGRHITSPSVLARRLSRFSALAVLFRWLKVSLEATYVNDLLDLSPDHLVRCCESDEVFAAPEVEVPAGVSPLLAMRVGVVDPGQVDAEVVKRLGLLRQHVAGINLVNLDLGRISSAITVGFVGTMHAMQPFCTTDEVCAALSSVEQRLGLADELRCAWSDNRLAELDPCLAGAS